MLNLSNDVTLDPSQISQDSPFNLGTCSEVIVPDRRCRVVPEVVLVRVLGNRGSGNLGGGGLGRGLGQGRSVYKQPETEVDGSCHS